MALKDTAKTINNSLALVSRLIESDTHVSNIDLNLIENLNTNQSLNYIKLEKTLHTIETNNNILININQEFLRYKEMIDQLDSRSLKLEELINELDRWSKELDTKAKQFH